MKQLVFLLFVGIIFIGNNMYAQQGKIWTLEDCIGYALQQNIDVQKSALNNQSYQEYAEQAKAQRFPNVSASVDENLGWSPKMGSGNSKNSYSVNSSVTLFNASRLNNQIKQAGLNVQGGEYSLETTRESISLSILNAFLQVLYAEEQVKNSEKQIESTTEQVNLAKERLTLQVISQADYLQVKSQLASEKLTLANSISQLAIAKVNLMQLMELPVTDSFEIAKPSLGEDINELRNPVVQAVFDSALAIKPQIKKAAIDKQVAQLDEKIAKAGYFPTLSANAGISTSYQRAISSGNSNTFDPYMTQLNDGLYPSLSLSLSIPIYEKRQVKTSVAIAKIDYQTAELTETNTKNTLRKNIEQACQDVKSAQVKYEASLENYQATKESSVLSDEKFKQGIINTVDYMVSKTNLITAESELLQSKFNLIFSYKIMDFYLGIPLTL
jgi:outer membrane protein